MTIEERKQAILAKIAEIQQTSSAEEKADMQNALNILTVTANDSTVGVQKQTVTYQKSPIRESDELTAAIAALA